MSAAVIIVYSGTNGLFDDVPIEDTIGAIADTLDIRMYCRRRRQPYPRSNRPRPQAGSLRF